MSSTSDAVCKGSIFIGTGCMTCDKCSSDLQKALSELFQNKEASGAGGLMGWRCPRCGAGNSPFNSRCGCVPMEFKVTC
jgi:hypothetical protein